MARILRSAFPTLSWGQLAPTSPDCKVYTHMAPRSPGQQNEFRRGAQLEAQGDMIGARAIYEAMSRQGKPDAELLYALARCEMAMVNYDAAKRHAKRAMRLQPDAPEYPTMLALVHCATGETEEAVAHAERALELRRDDPTAMRAKAEALRIAGQFEEGFDTLHPLVSAGCRDALLACCYAKLAMAVGKFDEAAGALRPLADDESLRPVDRSRVLFQLGSLLDRREAYDDAWEAFAKANALMAPNIDLDEFLSGRERRIVSWSAARLKTLARSDVTSELPVFIVGMPRSGTTLLEQILASHPEVSGGGERDAISRAVGLLQIQPRALAKGETDADTPLLARQLEAIDARMCNRIGKRLIGEMQRAAKGASRLTDKNMDNFNHLGFIQMWLPGARVIDCHRDPLDTCLSCFFNDFGSSQSYSYDLRSLGLYYREYERLMQHWRDVLDLQILIASYESLVADQERETRRMLEFLGLPFDEACLEFHTSTRVVTTLSAEQVRKPMYSGSVGRARHYEKHLEPLKEALAGA